MTTITTGYLEHVLDIEQMGTTIRQTVDRLQGRQFDAIAVTGMSGMLVGPTVAMLMHKKLIVIRKPNDNSHSGITIEGDTSAKTYIIIDDFISTGKTIENIIRMMENPGYFRHVKLVGIMLHADHLGDSFEKESKRNVIQHLANRWNCWIDARNNPADYVTPQTPNQERNN